jgi:hypothetical protein
MNKPENAKRIVDSIKNVLKDSNKWKKMKY